MPKFEDLGASVSDASQTSNSIFRSRHSPSCSFIERAFKFLLATTSWISLFTTIAIVIVLITQAMGFFREVSLGDFLFGTAWNPLIEPKSFGILPLLAGTLQIGLGALVVAVPLGAMAALFLSEYMKGTSRSFLKSFLEVLAGIPSVVYGFFAITFITPKLQWLFPETEIFNALSATLVVAVMIIPTICSVSADAFESVPRDLREAAYGLGARRYQVATSIVFPAGLSGFVTSIILGFSRAIGETMAVTLAAGATPRLTLNPLESIQTMTAYIVQVSLGDTPSGTVEYHSIFAVGLVLFVMTLSSNFIAQWITRRFQERYH